MALLQQAILVSRFVQITLAAIALCLAIISCVETDHPRDGGYFANTYPNGYLMMAAIMALFDTAALGVIGLLALLRPQVMEWWMVLVFDVLAITAAIAAGKCMYENAYTYYGWSASLRAAVIFSYLCIVPILVAIARAVYLQRRRVSDEGQIRLPDTEEVQNANGNGNGNGIGATMQAVRQLEKRIEQLETEARTRS